jgi:hypothetical protein
MQSEGGPLLLLPVALLPEWGGSDAPPPDRVIKAAFRWNPGGPATDYDRACDVATSAGHAGVIDVADGEGLVLGEEPADTTWLPTEWGGLLVRWVYAPGQEQAARSLDALPADLEWEPAGALRVADSPLELFDSAEPGLTPGRRLRIELPAGTYTISHAAYAPDQESLFHVVRLVHAPGHGEARRTPGV